MSKSKGYSIAEKYPYLARWLEAYGTVEFGDCYQTNSFIRVIDEGGMVWQGQQSYETLDEAFADCEAGIGQWLREELKENI